MALLRLLNGLINIYILVIIAQAVLSWFIRDPRSPVMLTLRAMTEPLHGPIRRALRLEGLALDPTPLISIMALMVVQALLRSLI